MPFFLPPAQTQPAVLAHLHMELKEARKAAKSAQRALCVVIPTDAAGQKEVVDYLDTLEGAKIRREMELCILDPQSKDAQHLIEQQEIHELPALLLFRVSAKETPNAIRRGKDALPVGQALTDISYSQYGDFVEVQEITPTAEVLKAKHPDITDPDLFIKYVVGLKVGKDLSAATEPYRSMLAGLLKSADPNLRGFAASRLLEANAHYSPGELIPLQIALDLSAKRMIDRLRGQILPTVFSDDRVEMKIEFGQQIADDSTFWPGLRSQISSSPLPITVGLYAMLAPELVATDRSWVLPCFKKGADQAKEAGPWENASYWLGVDWLLCYGEPADWQLFASVLDPKKGWSAGLSALQKSVESIPTYWKVPAHVQGMFCEGTNEENFWKAPDACLAEWGVTRENLIKLSMDNVREKRRSTLRYPEQAHKRHFAGEIRVQILIDPQGEVKAVRPFPGHALAFFAPEAMRFATACTFEPAVVAGVKRPSRFIYHMVFQKP